jgi:hypothetical protein
MPDGIAVVRVPRRSVSTRRAESPLFLVLYVIARRCSLHFQWRLIWPATKHCSERTWQARRDAVPASAVSTDRSSSPDRNEPERYVHLGYHSPIQDSPFSETIEMNIPGKPMLGVVLIASMMLFSAPSPGQVDSTTTDPSQGVKPTTISPPIGLYITLCLWSRQHPQALCREVPLTPGAAGPGFESMKACQDGQDEAVGRWRDQAAPVFGFTGMSGDGYRIEGGHCRPVAGDARDQEGHILAPFRLAADGDRTFEGTALPDGIRIRI